MVFHFLEDSLPHGQDQTEDNTSVERRIAVNLDLHAKFVLTELISRNDSKIISRKINSAGHDRSRPNKLPSVELYVAPPKLPPLSKLLWQ